MRRVFLVFVLLVTTPFYAGHSESRDAISAVEAGVPVFEGNVKRPYVVVGQINDNLRKPFAFLPNPTVEKILAEIWECARKMGADAVINARFGKTERTLLNHGRTPISGTAIKYTDVDDQGLTSPLNRRQSPGDADDPASKPPSRCTSLPVM